MKRSAIPLFAAVALFAGVAAGAPRADAWETETTAGLTEQAALASDLHRILIERFGFEGGLLAGVIVPPADAPQLFVILHKLLNPTHGYVPDRRGQLTALGWLVAGAVVADTPVEHAGHHFFDPTTGKGLSRKTLSGMAARLRHRVGSLIVRESVLDEGIPAPDWIAHPKNPMNLAGFRDQLVKAVRSRTPAERGRHLAGSLLAAGAILHVLQEMGSPSHVRDDLAAHYDQVGKEPNDLGSRFERVAALAFQRLGVPAPAQVVRRATPRDYFVSGDKLGLAQITSDRWFSAHTLPETFRKPKKGLGSTQKRFLENLLRPQPGPQARLSVNEGKVVDEHGVCLANIDLVGRDYEFSIGDRCALEQLGVILPTVAGYSAGLLDTLFAPRLSVKVEGGQTAVRGVVPSSFGAGEMTVYWDDRKGIRTRLAKKNISKKDGRLLYQAFAQAPREAVRITAMFVGQDPSGAPLVAVGSKNLLEEKSGEDLTLPPQDTPLPPASPAATTPEGESTLPKVKPAPMVDPAAPGSESSEAPRTDAPKAPEAPESVAGDKQEEPAPGE